MRVHPPRPSEKRFCITGQYGPDSILREVSLDARRSQARARGASLPLWPRTRRRGRRRAAARGQAGLALCIMSREEGQSRGEGPSDQSWRSEPRPRPRRLGAAHRRRLASVDNREAAAHQGRTRRSATRPRGRVCRRGLDAPAPAPLPTAHRHAGADALRARCGRHQPARAAQHRAAGVAAALRAEVQHGTRPGAGPAAARAGCQGPAQPHHRLEAGGREARGETLAPSHLPAVRRVGSAPAACVPWPFVPRNRRPA